MDGNDQKTIQDLYDKLGAEDILDVLAHAADTAARDCDGCNDTASALAYRAEAKALRALAAKMRSISH